MEGDSKKSPGFDSINGTMIKHLSYHGGIAKVNIIMNSVLKLKYIRSEVIIIANPGRNPNDINCSRPIFLLENGHQFGFRKKKN